MLRLQIIGLVLVSVFFQTNEIVWSEKKIKAKKGQIIQESPVVKIKLRKFTNKITIFYEKKTFDMN